MTNQLPIPQDEMDSIRADMLAHGVDPGPKEKPLSTSVDEPQVNELAEARCAVDFWREESRRDSANAKYWENQHETELVRGQHDRFIWCVYGMALAATLLAVGLSLIYSWSYKLFAKEEADHE